MRAHTLRVLVTLLFVAGISSESAKEAEPAPSPSEARVHKVLVKRTPVAQAQAGRAPARARLTALEPAPFAPPAAGARADRPQRSTANERWARFISEYASSGQRDSRSSQFPDWAKDAVMVDLPLAGESEGRPSSVPVLVLPVPVPVKDSSRRECSADQRLDNPERFEFSRPEPAPHRGSSRRPRPPPRKQARPVVQSLDEEEYDDYEEPAPAPAPRPRPARPRRPPPAPRDRPRPFAAQPLAVQPPTMEEARVNTQVLVELFRSQKPNAPQLPPALIRERRYDSDSHPAPAPPPRPAHSAPPPPPPARSPPRGYLPASPQPPAGAPSQTPPSPRFDRSLLLRGELTVYRADYTEPYTAIWDAASGAARIEMHGGATTSYRSASGGRMQRAVTTLDRSGEREVIRCALMRDSSPMPFDKIPPVLPDPTNFSFGGNVEFGNVNAEKWQLTVSGRAGELGAARGEALVFRHELLLTRTRDNLAMPLQYSVAVDSSVLGPDCDGYVHRYHEAREHQVDHSLFHIDLESSCDRMEETKEMSHVEPLLEFTMMSRDPRIDVQFKEFTTEFERVYADNTEEAVRKNLFTQTTRFVSSGNRLGATFEMGINFLSDRLDAELAELLGVVLDDEHFAAESFPHEKHQLRDLENKLPDEFDWRQKGGVTPVRYQGSCSSCWAFAVAGAVEGALFRVTRRLVALSEQCLVDCAHPYGGRGCGGTWPSHAYDYVQDRGLPALDEYPNYQAKVLQCQDQRVPAVTQISAHVNVTQYSVPALKVAIRRHAPTVVIIDANLKSFQTYKSGIFYDDRCAKEKRKLKHAVLAVGWGQKKKEPHFILKNSWSAAWGDGGYIRVHGPSNTCGVLALPSYPRLERADVLRGDGDAPRARGADDDYD